jgi:hypothetical protein
VFANLTNQQEPGAIRRRNVSMTNLRPFTISLAVSAVLLSACGGSKGSPTAPTQTQPSTYTLSGTLTATNGGQPLSGSIDVNGTKADASGGAFSFTLPTTMRGLLTLSISGGGLIDRRTYFAGGNSRTVIVDAIADGNGNGNGFDLNFYREIVRNGFEAPSNLQPLRRWTRAPQVYLKTIDESGAPIDAKTLDTTERAIVESVPVWTAGQFTPTVTRGTETREHQAGWITVVWPKDPDPTKCGQADIALEGGTVWLFYKTGGTCRCAGISEVRPRTVRHELGHAMGFWHTDTPSDVMFGGGPGCDAMPSARERYHAAVAYRRPVGNSDPDNDPSGTVNLAPMKIP